jgi:hypothetical protein
VTVFQPLVENKNGERSDTPSGINDREPETLKSNLPYHAKEEGQEIAAKHIPLPLTSQP